MDEAEQLADRVAIINHGRLVTVGTPGEVAHSVAVDHVRFRTGIPIEAVLLSTELGVTVDELGRNVYQIDTPPTSELLAALTAWLARSDVLLTELSAGNRSLEDAFLAYTRRDDAP
jgi:ABC-2 type transport system ATP-binding protein